MSQPQASSFKEVDIDYITATANRTSGDSGLAAFGRFIVSTESRRGFKSGVYRAQNYRGLHAGGACFGRRHDGELVRLSGPCAAEFWEQVIGLSSNITRLDVQTTVRSGERPARRLKQHLDQLRRFNKSRGKPLRIHFEGGGNGLECVYSGSRQSEIMLRVYDKHAESGNAEYDGCLRYELEFKGEKAWAMAHALDSRECWRTDAVAFISKFATKRALILRWPVVSFEFATMTTLQLRSRVRQYNDPDRRRLTFVSKCVRPMVQRLIEAGYEREVMAALGLERCVSPEVKLPAWAKDLQQHKEVTSWQ